MWDLDSKEGIKEAIRQFEEDILPYEVDELRINEFTGQVEKLKKRLKDRFGE